MRSAVYKSVAKTRLAVLLNCLSILVVVLFTFFSSPSFAFEDTSKLKKATLQLKWKHQFQFAGYYIAKAKGYYAQEGLNIEIIEGGAKYSAIDRVLAGNADFGIGDSDILLARAQGKPLVALAAIFQHSPYIILSRRDQNIRTPSDLIGKRVMMSKDQGAAQLMAMLTQEGIATDLVSITPHSWDLNDLIQGKVDAMSAYSTVEPEYLRKSGVSPAVLNSMNYGVDFYGDIIFATEAMIAEHPKKVDAFLRASFKGWRYALEHVEETADLIHKMNGVSERVSREMLIKEGNNMRPLILPDLIEIGHMNPGRWQTIANILVNAKIANIQPDINGFIYEPKKPIDSKLFSWIAVVIGLLLLSSAFFVYWNIRIRRRVEATTGELDTEIKFRKKIESRLENSQVLVRLTFHATGAGIAIMDTRGKFLIANPAYCRMVGYTETELLEKDIQSITHHDDKTKNMVQMDMLLEGSIEDVTFEKRYLKKEGEVVWIRASISLVRSPETGLPINLIAVTENITDRKRLEMLKIEQDTILERIAVGAPLLETLNSLITTIENQYSNLICSIHLLSADGKRIHHGASINLPSDYIDALEGVEIGPTVGSCGTAAFEHRTVIVEDIANDPLWANYKELALKYGLHSCWSMPVYTSKNQVLGTFAVYSKSISRPDESQLALLESFSHIVGIAIEKHNSEENLKLADSHIRDQASLLDRAQDAIIVRNIDNRVVYWNKGAEKLYGWKSEEVIDHLAEEILYEDLNKFEDANRKLLEDGEWSGELTQLNKNGQDFLVEAHWTLVRDEAGKPKSVLCINTNITQRKEAEKKIQQLAFYDNLTGLPNRQLLLDRLQVALNSTLRKNHHGAILFIDLDNFKTLNDAMGHDYGDMLLRQVAQRLTSCVRDGDTVARLGGDEFVVMLNNLSFNNQEAASQTQAIGNKILNVFNLPFRLEQYEYHTTTSIGVALIDDQSTTVDILLKRADMAMYQAKNSGRNTIRFFDPAMQAIINDRVELEASLRLALVQKDFILFYQSQVDEKGNIFGFEALIRWKDPVKGMISPAFFIPLAEESGLILPIGLWVMETACQQLVEWGKDFHTSHLSISVNVSARQFKQSNFVSQVTSVIGSTGANPDKLKLELTESMLADDVEEIIKKMTSLKALGIRFSLDDFGTGYSSLSYLKRLPLNQLKIDQSFVRNVCSDNNDAAITRAIITLGQTLGLSVIAEGVETIAQKDFLISNGCYHFQGYLFSKPLIIDQVNAMLSNTTDAQTLMN